MLIARDLDTYVDPNSVTDIRNQLGCGLAEAVRMVKKLQIDDALNDLSTAVACDSNVDLKLVLLDLIDIVKEMNVRLP